MAVPLSDIEPLRPVLWQRPLGLCSDIDGTLAPIVPRPEDAAVSPACRRLLGELLERGVRVALISGRPLATARRMVGLEGAAYAGNHGLELWVDGREQSPADVGRYVALASQVEADLVRLADRTNGIEIENKGPVLALHYRRAVDGEAARRSLLAGIEASEAAKAFRVHEGRRVVELRPPLAVDKGTALAAIVKRLGLRGVLCLGDDVTDIDMFRGVERLRREGLDGATVAVLSEEAAPELAAAADYSVAGVAGVEWLLAEVLTGLP